MIHKLTMMVCVGIEVEADDYRHACEIVGKAIAEPGAVTIAGAEGYGITVVGIEKAPPLDLDKPPPAKPTSHDLSVDSVGMENRTRH